MKEDTRYCLNKMLIAIKEKDKHTFESYLTAFYIKARRDIRE